jgi:hypothetical protein
MSKRFLQIILVASVLWRGVPGLSQETVSQDIAQIQDFEKRIDGYMQLRKTAEGKLPRLTPTESPAAISQHEKDLGQRIREARLDARQGDIFTPEIVVQFQRLIGLAGQGKGADHIKKSLKHAEPVAIKLRVNDIYPAGVPLQSTPPTLILNLPKVPQELDYRVVGHDLVLRDSGANLVVDFIPGVIP